MLAGKLPVTGLLTGMSFVLILAFSHPPRHFHRPPRRGAAGPGHDRTPNQVLMAMPAFVTGILLTYVFGLVLRWFLPGKLCFPGDNLGRQPVVLPAPRRVHRPAQGGHDGEDAALVHSAGAAEGLCPYLPQPGQQRSGYPARHVLRNAMGPVVSFLAMTVVDIVAWLRGHRAGILPAGAGPDAADLHRQPGLSRGAGGVVVIVAFWVVLVNLLADLIASAGRTPGCG
ncbi:MAG: hypothetical protein V8S97_02965 [Oscillospiraceae bacterium]